MEPRNDYFHAITSLALITISCDDAEEQLYVYLLVIISAINHMIPSDYRNNNIIKPILSKVLLRNENMPKYLKDVIVCLDILPIISTSLKTEHIGALIRQYVILKNIPCTLKK